MDDETQEKKVTFEELFKGLVSEEIDKHSIDVKKVVETRIVELFEEVDFEDQIEDSLAKFDFEEKIDQAVKSYDYEAAIEEAISEFDIDEKISDACDSFDFEEKIDDAFGDYDLEGKIRDALDDSTLERDVERAVERTVRDFDYETKLNATLDVYLDTEHFREKVVNSLNDKDIIEAVNLGTLSELVAKVLPNAGLEEMVSKLVAAEIAKRDDAQGKLPKDWAAKLIEKLEGVEKAINEFKQALKT